jgi:hypothetical protein
VIRQKVPKNSSKKPEEETPSEALFPQAPRLPATSKQRSDDEASERVGGRERGVRGGFACFWAAAFAISTNGFMKNLPLYIVAFAALLAVFVVP